MRVLLCSVCKSAEEAPDFVLEKDQQVDPIVEGLVYRHTERDPMAHGTLKAHFSPFRLISFSDIDWRKDRARCIKLMNEENKKSGFNLWIEEAADTYAEDAMRCFSDHHRPQDGCIDWMDDSKLLGHPTSEGEKTARQMYRLAKNQPHLCQWCFDGSTRVITKTGTFRIDELAEIGHAELLIPPTHGSWSTWRDCEVRQFGEQRLWEIKLKRGRHSKTVLTTAEHTWYLTNEQEYRPPSHKKTNARRQTAQLKADDLLEYAQTPPLTLFAHLSGGYPIVPSAFGVAQGFVFGDGTDPGNGRYGHERRRTLQPAFVRLYGTKDKALLPFFAAAEPKQVMLDDTYGDDYCWEVRNLPRTWKQAPDLTESKSFLLGWLAGYFAADGSVDKRGTAYLESAVRENLELARTICYQLGIMTEEITERFRLGRGKQPSALYRLFIYAPDLPESFWLLDHHRQRVESRAGQQPSQPNWQVVDVQQTDVVAPVYCAVVPGVEKFVLADNLSTGNCPVASYVNSKKAGNL